MTPALNKTLPDFEAQATGGVNDCGDSAKTSLGLRYRGASSGKLTHVRRDVHRRVAERFDCSAFF